MAKVIIRECLKDDEKGIVNVCYRTGYMGEDLTDKGEFNDAKLFGYLFCLYYPRYEPQNCFVAVDLTDGDIIVGYVIGTDNTYSQRIRFAFKMVWKIVLRLFSYTAIVHPESFSAVMYFIKNAGIKDGPDSLYKEYPAHLHINVLAEYQHMGIGSMLMEKFEEHIKKIGAAGVHLKTSNRNIKAITFYKKKGYDLIYEKEQKLWRNIDNYKSMIFAKKLR